MISIFVMAAAAALVMWVGLELALALVSGEGWPEAAPTEPEPVELRPGVPEEDAPCTTREYDDILREHDASGRQPILYSFQRDRLWR